MKKNLYISLSVTSAFLLQGCLKTEFEPFTYTEGEADFTNYVSVGNSLTQGYQDGGLHNEKGQQENSYPSMIAKQMALVNPEMNDFIQPLVSGNGSGYMKLGVDGNGEIGVVSQGDPGGEGENANWGAWGNKMHKYNNLGVAGIAVWQIQADGFNEKVVNHAVLGGVGLIGGEPLNPYGRFLDFGQDPTNIISGEETYDYIHHIKESEATFFTCWLGNNDVLGWSLNGGDPDQFSVAGIGIIETSPLTETVEFREKYEAAVKAFYDQGAQGVCATLPDVTTIPMITTVNEAFLEEDEIWITEGVSGNVRKKTPEDMVTLYALDDIQNNGEGLSQSNPLRHTYVLDAQEVLTAQNRIEEFNTAIKQIASKYGYGVVDMHEHLNDFNSGFSVDGVDFSAKFIEGGVFSLDGVHPNPKGYAIIANKFIEGINAHYGSNIPKVDVNAYKGIVFPND